MSEYILNLLPLHEGEREEFESIAPGAVHVYAGRSTVTPEQLAAATIIFGWPRPEAMGAAVNLKWFQTMWAGADDYAGKLPEGVLFTSSSGSNSRSVAEHMLTCLLSLCRCLPAYRDSQRARRWKDEGPMKTILGACVLVVGVGTMDELDALLPRADVVALVVPHSPETAGLIGADRIALMKDDAILLSAGRGSVLDQAALAEAMGTGKLWGAALDVTTPEPLPAGSPLWELPNLLLTPHVAGGMRLEITRRRCVEMAQENLRRYLAGEELENIIE